MRRQPGKPRVIRGVIARYRDAKHKGQPKIARDRKTGIDMERVVARDSRRCARRCARMIGAGTAYAKVTDYNTPGPFIAGRRITPKQDYHFECVPPEAKPLVRFLR